MVASPYARCRQRGLYHPRGTRVEPSSVVCPRSVVWSESRLLGLAGVCIFAGSVLVLRPNSGLTLHDGVPRSIFVVYGICGVSAGVLYVVPPFNFYRRGGGETIVCGVLGLVPVLGAYLVQVGDLTRTVYLASAPVVVATALWVWTDELITGAGDEKEGRRTMVVFFGSRLSGRFVVPVLSLFFYAPLFLAVLSSSIPPWVLALLLTLGLVHTIVITSWHHYDGSTRLRPARSNAFAVHLVTGIIVAASSLAARVSWPGSPRAAPGSATQPARSSRIGGAQKRCRVSARPREVNMTGRTQPALAQAPEWVTAEMPPGYHTRLVEIERLSGDLHAMDRIGCVLWETGEPLRDAVSAIFAALKCDVDATSGSAGPIAVKLDESRRLLLLVSGAASPIQKTHEELVRAFQAVQFAGANDRVVFVTNNDPATPPADRPDPLSSDAREMLHSIGVDVVATATLFRLWRLAFEDERKARIALEHLHAQEGGPFSIPGQ
jgi:1,4-dihydroxy-2-naphthoate octaprenyltransferase